MNVSIPSLLLTLGGKCLLNWLLLYLQRSHVCRSFVGVFSVSLSVVDTALTLALATVHLHSDGQVFLFGLQLTRYHLCLLVQIVGELYNTLQFPVVVVAGLDHYCTISQRLQPATARRKWIVHLFVTAFLWYLTTLYIFVLSGFVPVLEDVSHRQIRQCWTYPTYQILQVATFLYLTLGYATVHTGVSVRLFKNPSPGDQLTEQSSADSRQGVILQALRAFLKTWALLLVVLAVLFLLSVAVPSYLGLNVAWLCFLNSFLIGVVFCVVCPSLHTANALAAVPPDSFCEWRFKFSLAAEDTP